MDDECAVGRTATGLSGGFRLSDRELHAFQQLVRAHTGITLDDNKRQMLVARLGRRLRHHGLATFREYYELITQRDPQGEELAHMVSRVTTHTTNFFREPHHLEFLRTRVFGEGRENGTPLRIWSCAASTGEEPYSIAMTSMDSFGERASAAVEILATDIDTDALQTAARGVYETDRLTHVPPARWQPYFQRGTGQASGQVKVRPELRRLVRFLPLNLNDGGWPSLGPFDVIFCRNVLIYFDSEVRRVLMERLARRLAPGGYLVLGHAENLPHADPNFEPVFRTVYRLREGQDDTGPEITAPASTPSRAQWDRSLGAGDVLASREPIVLRTVLGSCVSACLYDPTTGIGGMNHFALPTPSGSQLRTSRYGVHAMEVLINEIMGLGGDRRRLRAKVFGACNVLRMDRTTHSVASQNAAFVREFLATESIPLVAQRLGGTRALELLFETATGRALAREVGRQQAATVLADEAGYRARIHKRQPDDVTLFTRSKP